MANYQWVGKNKENVIKGTIGVNLVMCEDCGDVLELKTDIKGYCGCNGIEYHKWDDGWNRVKVE